MAPRQRYRRTLFVRRALIGSWSMSPQSSKRWSVTLCWCTVPQVGYFYLSVAPSVEGILLDIIVVMAAVLLLVVLVPILPQWSVNVVIYQLDMM